MAVPVEPPSLPLPENPPRPSEPTQNQTPVVIKQETTPATDTKKTSSPSTLRPPEPSSSTNDVIVVPSYSTWFSWNNIHDCERRFLPEFFDGKSHSKNPKIYMYYRDSIIKRYRRNPSRKITFTEVRKTLVGDVGSIRRVFDFLEGWGLINYTAPTGQKVQQTRWEEKDSKSGGGLVSTGGDSGGSNFESSVKRVTSKLCSGCQSVCSIACFACDKFDLTLCARCYVRGNYRVGLSAADFKRVEISEDTETDWTDKDTLHLMEAILHYGDDWKKVSHHVGGKSEKECVSRFINLSFGEEFAGPTDSRELDKYYPAKGQSDAETVAEKNVSSSPKKRRHLTPLTDASNPIVAQVAFLSAMVGSEVAEAAARGAVSALSEVDFNGTREAQSGRVSSITNKARPEECGTTNGEKTKDKLQNAILEARGLLDKEEKDVERSISGIVDVQMKEIQDKIVQFEEVELLMEKEWQQVQHMKNMFFIDQQNLLHQRIIPSKLGESRGERVKTTDAVT